MLPVPICSQSHKLIHKFCISQQCNQIPFICKFCEDQTCMNVHLHHEKFQNIDWMKFMVLYQNYAELDMHLNLDHLHQQIENIIEDLKKLETNYAQKMEQYHKKFNYSKQTKQLINQLKNKKYENLNGAKMKRVYQQLFSKEYYRYNYEMIELLKFETTQIQKTIINIKESIEQYYKRISFQKFLSEQNHKKLDQINSEMYIHPQQSEIYYRKGLLYYQIGQLQESMHQFLKAIKYNKNNYRAYIYLGKILKNDKYITENQQKYQKQILENPNNCIAYFIRGRIYHDQGNFQKALLDYNTCIEIDPKYSQVYNNIGVVYSQLNQLQKSIYYYTKAIQFDPNYSYAYTNRGNSYNKLNRLEQALNDYTIGIEKDNMTEFGYKNRAILYKRLNRNRQAQEDQQRHEKFFKLIK